MAASVPTIADLVRDTFVVPYYETLARYPHLACRFYDQHGVAMLVDGGTVTQLAMNLPQIQALHMSLNISSVEFLGGHTVGSAGVIMTIVSGILSLKQFNGKRGFTEIFFVRPHGSGYTILVDILFFREDLPETQHLAARPTLELDSQNLLSLIEPVTEILKAIQNSSSMSGGVPPRFSEIERLICDLDGIRTSNSLDRSNR